MPEWLERFACPERSEVEGNLLNRGGWPSGRGLPLNKVEPVEPWKRGWVGGLNGILFL